MNLYVLSYNNYYNRIVKKEDSFQSYAPFVIYGPVQGVYGFTPGDGVNTVQVLGSNIQMYNGEGDYLLAVGENNEIDSRWFIIDTKRERSGQWTLTLRRDLIVDFYDQVLESPMFIEKATLSDNDNLIYNNEDFSVNQIFTSQTLLKDQSGCGWFIGYYPTNVTGLTGTIKTNDIAKETFEILPTPIENWEYYEYSSNNPLKAFPTRADLEFYFEEYVQFVGSTTGVYELNMLTKECYQGSVASRQTTLKKGTSSLISFIATTDYYTTDEYLNNISSYATFSTQAEMEDVLKYNGKIILDSTGTYYQVSITPSNVVSQNVNVTSGSLFNFMSTIASTSGMTGTANNKSFILNVETPTYVIQVNELPGLATTYSIPDANRLNTTNTPYNIFAIPFGEITIKDGNETIITNKSIAASAIASILDNHANNVYDAQLIGYCPVNYLLTGEKEITVTDNFQVSYITDQDNNKLSAIFNVPSSSFTLNIPITVNYENKKIANTCDLYRLTAPDQSSYFDINIAKNNGISFVNIDVELKPYNAYVHANPDFKGLYGRDFNTGRGLIYGANLSLSRALNNYTEYQIQNSQFQNIFDRQVQNMEVQHEIGRIQDVVGVITGTASGAASGGLLGSMIGSTPAGMIGGGLASGAGGIADIGINEKLRTEALDYTKDMFGYQLATIKALPNTLSKITALTQNNTIFIALDYYTCTDREKQAFANKIAWNGMTVMAIGKINDYINNNWSYNGIESKGYIKGKLIRLEGTDDDYHIVNSLAGELNKGVYIK